MCFGHQYQCIVCVWGCCSFSKPVFLILTMIGQFATQWGLA